MTNVGHSALLKGSVANINEIFVKLLTDCTFEPVQCYASTGISHHRVYMCGSVTRRYCVKMAKCTIMQTMPRDSPGTLVF